MATAPTVAAFFDLDRTLLRGASGPVIGEALAAAGVIPTARIPGQELLVRIYDLVGETLPSMALARQAASRAAGWVQEAVQEAGEKAAEEIGRAHV